MNKHLVLVAILQLVVLLMLAGCDNSTSTDENHDPTDISLSSTGVAENAAAGTVVGTFSATDEDDGDIFTFTLVSGGADNASFSIDGYSLKTKEVFDYETKDSYSIKIQADDDNGGTFQKAFTIAVTDVNEPNLLGVYTERTVNSQLDFDVHVWASGESVILNGAFPDAFEGSQGFNAADAGVGWTGWGFYAAKGTNVNGYDLSSYQDGSLHIAIKGTSPDVGIAVLPMEVGVENYVMASAYGYTPNSDWVEMTIPLSVFNLSTNISTIKYFVTFLQTVENGGFQAGTNYTVDDIYFAK